VAVDPGAVPMPTAMYVNAAGEPVPVQCFAISAKPALVGTVIFYLKINMANVIRVSERNDVSFIVTLNVPFNYNACLFNISVFITKDILAGRL
jgi:hypothetical protein